MSILKEVSLDDPFVVPAMQLVHMVAACGEMASFSEARRIINQGGVRIDGFIQTDPARIINLKPGVNLDIGKKQYNFQFVR